MTRCNAFFALVLATLLLVALPAQAGILAGVKEIDVVAVPPGPGTLRVFNDGNQYTHVTQSHVTFTTQTDLECKINSHMIKALLVVGTATTANGQLGPQPGPFASVYDSVNGRLSLLRLHVNELFAPPARNPAQLCNTEMGHRIAAGSSKQALLQHGFSFQRHYDLTFVANCKSNSDNVPIQIGDSWQTHQTEDQGWGSAGTSQILTIRCEGNTGGGLSSTPTPPKPPRPASDDLAVPFQVTRAALDVSPKNATTECPATLTANGSITVVGSGTVQYRVEHNGALGPIQEMHFPANGPKGRALSFKLEVGNSEGGQLVEAGAGGGGGGGGIGGFAAEDAPDGKVGGSLRLMIVSPQAGVDHSNPTGYNVTCKAPAPTAKRMGRGRR